MTTSKWFYLLLCLKALGMALLILFSGVGLGPDEAQYWTWSRHLDIGYYSKPPGVAWQIFLSTGILGSTELGVRLSAIILGTLFALSVHRLAIKSGCNEDAAAFSGLMAAFTPLGFFSTFLAITDGGLLLFWTLGLTVLAEAVKDSKTPSYLFLGLFIALGALFKWPIYLLWAVAIVMWVFCPKMRRISILAGVGISLLGLLPTLIWNAGHEFATFKHVFTIVKGGNDGGASGNPLEFIGSQIALISPIIFFIGCVALFYFRKATSAIRFLAAVTMGILGAYILYSFFKKGQGNWCLFAYPSLFVLIGAVFSEGKKRAWIKWGLVLSSVLVLTIFALPTIQKNSLFGQIPWKINPFKHNLGWENLNTALKDFNPTDEFLFADKYQNTSILSFYNPTQAQAYFFNLLGSRKNQFSYWNGPEAGKKGYFVVVENGKDLDEKMKGLAEEYSQRLAPYFETIHPPKRISLFQAYEVSVKEALIFPCENYLGNLPPNPEKY